MDRSKAPRRSVVAAALACALSLLVLLWIQGRDVDPRGRSRPVAANATSVGATPPPAGGAAGESPAEGAPAAAAPAPAGEARERTVIVRGPRDAPLSGVLVRAFSKPGDWYETDVRGRATIPFAPDSPDFTVRLSGLAPEILVKLDEPVTVVRLPDLLPISVLIVDGETGEWVGGADVRMGQAHGPSIPMEAHGARHTLPLCPARPGERVGLRFQVDPPPDYAGAATRFPEVHGIVSAFARSVEVTIPLYREATLLVRVLEADGTPAAGSSVSRVLLGGTPVPFTADPVGAEGVTRIHGVPALRGEPVAVRASKDPRSAVSDPVRLGPRGMPVEAVVRLPAARDGRRSLRAEGGGSATASSGVILLGKPVPGSGRVVARVYRRDGSPAIGARVRFVIVWEGIGARSRDVVADGEGAAVCDGLKDAKVTVTVREPGFLAPSARTVEVGNAETVSVQIREAAPASATVTVLDADGLPVPFARLTVADRDRVAYARLEGDRQVLTLFTDLEGRVVLPDLPAGATKLTARFGSREATGMTQDGAPLTLRLPR